MGSAMESFCCANKDELNDSINQPNPNNSTNSSALNITGKIPTNEMKMSNDLGKIIQVSSKHKGSIPFSDYELVDKIEQGENSEVYIVKNKDDKKIFVLKKLKRDKTSDLTEKDIKKKIDSLKQLNHPYITKIYEYYISDDYIYLIEEFCSEGNLQDKLKKIKIFPEFIVKIIMFQIFKSLIYLGSKKMEHGNLKLENILIELNNINPEKKVNKKNYNFNKDELIKAMDNDVNLVNNGLSSKLSITNYRFDIKQVDSIRMVNKKINDSQKRVESSQLNPGLRFGSLKKADDKLRAIPNLKYTGAHNIYNSGKFEMLKFGIKLDDFNCSKIVNRNKTNMKNIYYLSPEIINNNNNENENCDIWACGIIMYYLLGGIFPFPGEKEDEIKTKISSGKLAFDFDKFNGISEDAKDLIRKCLKKDKSRRLTIIDALAHPFFDDLKDSKIYLEDEKEILKNLKNQQEHPLFYQMVLTFISYHFDDIHLLLELSRIFYKIDANTDGKITKEDLKNAYEEAGEKISKDELEEIINMVDFDKNGFIEYEEFIRVCIPEDRLFTDTNLKNAFDLFDTEKKGEITYMQVVDALEKENHINSKMIASLKKEVSSMGDELLNYEKFKSYMHTLSLQ